jgi:hypothetical protein
MTVRRNIKLSSESRFVQALWCARGTFFNGKLSDKTMVGRLD